MVEHRVGLSALARSLSLVRGKGGMHGDRMQECGLQATPQGRQGLVRTQGHLVFQFNTDKLQC